MEVQLNQFLGCCLYLSCISKTYAQMGNLHTIASTNGFVVAK